MENNQEHKLDSFFKKSLENQAFPPPENIWSNIAAETIAKESAEITPLLRYTLLSLGLIITAGIAFWFLTDNKVAEEQQQEIASIATEVYPKQQEFANQSGETTIKNNSENDIKTEKNDVENSRSNLLNVINHLEKKSENATFHRKSTNLSRINIPTIVDAKMNNSAKQVSVAIGNNNGEILITDKNLVNNKLKTLSHKDLLLKDLSIKNHKNLLGKILPIQSLADKEKDKHEDKPESTGSKFSLKHPIISFDYGVLANTWEFKSENSLDYNIVYPEKSSGTYLKTNIAWKITEKSRMGISLAYNSYNLGKPYFNIPLWSSYWGVPTVYLNTKNDKQYYSAIMPTGTVNIPAERFAEVVKLTPDTIHSSRKMLHTEDLRMTTFTLGISTQNDILNLQSKKKKHLNLKIYGIADFTFQRQVTYHYTATDFISTIYWTGGTMNNNREEITYDSKHLENASDFIFGVRVGVGLGWKFTPKLGLHLEGTTQNSFNSWVQNQALKTYMRSNALNVGVHLGL